MLTELRKQVLEANLELVRRGLVLYTFGNASALSRPDGLVVIKPSGVSYDRLTPDDMVVVDLTGRIVEGDLRPSVDLATHLALYRAFPAIGAVVHTHSEYATIFAQAGRSIPALGTTHADYFSGPIPTTRVMTNEEINGDYVAATGAVIVERILGDPLSTPAALVAGHGPFCWGAAIDHAVETAVVLEAVARMALYTLLLRPDTESVSQALLTRHYVRKHGSGATYGQNVE
jgi:L-ribulose-5-phosphate 4-epimerase